MLPREDIGFLRRKDLFGIRGACDEPKRSFRGQEPDGPVILEPVWRRMLSRACSAVVTTIAWRTMLCRACSAVVRTIALEEDAPMALAIGGDDDYLEEDAPSSFARWW